VALFFAFGRCELWLWLASGLSLSGV